MPIHYEQLDGHVARITIDRPEARNSLDLYHFRDLAQAWRRFRDDPDDWVAIVTGVDGNFMTGADLKTYIPQITELQQQIQAGDVDEIDGCRLRDGTDAVLRSLKIYKPIIAAVDGPCVAGGMEMLGGIDIRIATERATFGVMEPKRGLFAGGGTTVRLPRQLAYPAAMEFLLTAEAFPASRALELGLLNEIVPGDRAGRPGPRVGGPHHRERAARGAGHQGERAARPRRRPARGLQDRERAGRQGVLVRRRQGGPEGVRREARPPLDRHVTQASAVSERYSWLPAPMPPQCSSICRGRDGGPAPAGSRRWSGSPRRHRWRPSERSHPSAVAV